MAAAILINQVEDYDRWRPKFDSMGDVRREYRIGGERVFQDATNPNRLIIILEGDPSDLQAYSQSQVLKEAMAEAGVVGAPEFSLVNDVT